MNNNSAPIVFLDQFVFNKIAKSLDNNSISCKEEEYFWQELHDCMVNLTQSKKCKFPWSPFREEETLVFEESEKIEKVKNNVSAGLYFKSPDFIWMEQVHEYIKAWADRKCLSDVKLETKSVLETIKDKNAWANHHPDKYTIDWQRLKNNTRSSRKNVNDNILQCDEFLKSGKIFLSEKGDKAIRLYVDERHNEYLKAIKNISHNSLEFMKLRQLGDSFINEYLSKNISGASLCAAIDCGRLLIVTKNIADFLEDRNPPYLNKKVYLNKQIYDFLDSEYFKAMPIFRIEYYLYALLARKLSSGQKKVDNIHTDLEAIANYLPYCSAMFVDNECASLLSERIIITDLAYNTKVFSTRTKGEFLQYLKQLR